MTSVESLTKALRDFAYAVPEDVRDAALTVAADLAAERKRREAAERERDEARAERHTEWKAKVDALAARERAEADNAALLELLRRSGNGDGDGMCLWCGDGDPHRELCPIRAVLAANHPGAALLERLRALERFTSAARDLEWQRHDWQGLCVFRRAAGCDGTDGRYSALGTPKPRPHSENCPFHGLNALEKAP